MRDLNKDEQKAMQAALRNSVEVVDEGSMSASPACSTLPGLTNAEQLEYERLGNTQIGEIGEEGFQRHLELTDKILAAFRTGTTDCRRTG